MFFFFLSLFQFSCLEVAVCFRLSSSSPTIAPDFSLWTFDNTWYSTCAWRIAYQNIKHLRISHEHSRKQNRIHAWLGICRQHKLSAQTQPRIWIAKLLMMRTHHLFRFPCSDANNNNPSAEMNCKHLNVMTNNLFSIAQAGWVSTRANFVSPEQFSSIIEQQQVSECSPNVSFIIFFWRVFFSVFVFASSLDHKTTTRRAGKRKSFPYLKLLKIIHCMMAGLGWGWQQKRHVRAICRRWCWKKKTSWKLRVENLKGLCVTAASSTSVFNMRTVSRWKM